MKPKFLVERGQALILIALAAIGLFGVTGLAIDGSARFSDRRHAQNAADAASLAGALAYGNLTADPVYDANGNLVTPIDWKVDALNIADDNGYNGNHVRSEVKVYLCSEHDASCGPGYAGSTQYVQVIITSYVKTYFARVIGLNQTQNTVQAIALAKRGGPLYEGNSIVALNPHSSCPGSLRVGGSGPI
jgi:Flp pilus assembly protein TadG